MKTVYIIALIILPISTLFVARAADTGNVTATVTVSNIALTVADGSVTYGTLSTSGTANTTATGLNDSQTATNTGNVAADFNIKGVDSAAWTLETAIGSEQYKHDFCITDCDGTPTWTPLTTDYAVLADAVAASGTQVFDLRINTPSSTATFTAQNVNVTVQAVAD